MAFATKTWRRIAIGLVAAAFMLLAGGYGLLMQDVFDRALSHRIAAVYDSQPEFDADALHVFLCGSSSPIASTTRAKACIGVVADGKLYLFDVGAGAWNNIILWRIPQHTLNAVFLTHFHSDHFADLGEANVQSWIWGRTRPVSVFGPHGTGDVAEGFNRAFAHDYDVSNRQAGEAVMPRAAAEMAAIEFDAGHETPVFVDGEFSVYAVNVDHVGDAPAYGYIVRYRGRSVVISGDTMKSPTLIEAARDADVIFHEAYSERMISMFSNAIMLTDDERARTFGPRFAEAQISTEEAI